MWHWSQFAVEVEDPSVSGSQVYIWEFCVFSSV